MKTTQLLNIFLIRCSVCLLIILANVLVSDYDLSSSIPFAQKLPRATRDASSEAIPFLDRYLVESGTSPMESKLLKLTTFIASSFVSWDSVYFVEISKNLQYRMEHMHAFFPGMPALVYAMRKLGLDWWTGREYLYVSTVLCAVLVANLSFVAACVVLYHLTRVVFARALSQSKRKDVNLDRYCTLVCYLFALSPASVFCSVPYTEPLFALLSFMGMYLWSVSKGNSLKAAILFGLATFVRGNGILLAGFFVYGVWKMKSSWWRFPLQLAFTWLPYVAVQYLAFTYYCTGILNENLWELSSVQERTQYLEEYHPWCLKDLPHLYSYAQKKYWNVGLFRYWTVAQIPNFLLAAPVIFISLSGIYAFCKGRVMPFLFVRSLPVSEAAGQSSALQHLYWFQRGHPEATVYFYYLLFMVLYVLFGAHVQILTRFLVASPALHWITALLFLENSRWRKFIVSYHLVYIFVGCTLFTNFYPWT